jgi:hypothetical protein
MTPEFQRFRQQFDSAVPQGLTAAAEIYHGALRRKLLRGYTTGKFVTGTVAASVQIAAPSVDADEWNLRVGTNLMYALYWEMGHHNVFTHRYEREQVWLETLGLSGSAMAAAMGHTVNTVLQTGVPAAPADGFAGFDS